MRHHALHEEGSLDIFIYIHVYNSFHNKPYQCALNLKPLYTFWTEYKKVHRFTNYLQGLQKVMVKDRLLWKYYSMKCFTFWENNKTIINSQYRELQIYLNTCHDTVKQGETRVGFPVIFSRLRWRIEPKFHMFVILYISCWPLDNTVTESVQ